MAAGMNAGMQQMAEWRFSYPAASESAIHSRFFSGINP